MVPSLKDVAERAGVSVSTASIALRQDPRVREETRRRIAQAAEELGYRPNGIARDLKTRRTGMIAILLHSLGGPFFSELVRGIEDAAHVSDFMPIVSSSGKDDSALRRFLLEKRVDGAIILNSNIDEEILQTVASESMPIVVLDRSIHLEHACTVTCDHRAGARRATLHLMETGHPDVAFISGPADSYHGRLRHDGYVDAHASVGRTVDGRMIYHGTFTESSGYDIARQMVADGGVPQAIFAANDEMAIGALRAFGELCVRVPQDVAIVGFDDIRLANYVTPSLSTVRQPMYDLGVTAANTLLRMLKGERGFAPDQLQTELIVRQSSIVVAG